MNVFPENSTSMSPSLEIIEHTLFLVYSSSLAFILISSFARTSIPKESAQVWLNVNFLSLEPILPLEINEIPHPSTFALLELGERALIMSYLVVPSF